MSSNTIHFYSENISFVLAKKTIVREWIQHIILEKNCIPGNISIVFCNDEYLHQLNVHYLNHDTLTDIISFDYTEDKTISGDLFISYERIKENAQQLKIKTNQELHRVMIHGILHLLGYKDKSKKDKQEMTEEENRALELLKKLS